MKYTQGEKSKGAEKNNRSKSGTDVADSAPSRGFGAKKISNVRGKRANANRNARPTKGVPKRLVIEEDVGSMVDGGNDAGHDEEEVVDWAMGQKLVEVCRHEVLVVQSLTRCNIPFSLTG